MSSVVKWLLVGIVVSWLIVDSGRFVLQPFNARLAPEREDAQVTPSGGGPRAVGLPEFVRAAAAGDASSWEELVDRFGGMIIAIARSCRLGDSDVWEVHQTTWLRLVENIGRIEQPERIGAWLATTAKRESLRLAHSRDRLLFIGDGFALLPDDTLPSADAGPIAAEQAALLRKAIAELPLRCQVLLGFLAQDDSPSYKETSAALSMPIGSIGPTRSRCLEHLHRIISEMQTGVR
jgi:RNA polymerase sigma factor (sigma-70 family)